MRFEIPNTENQWGDQGYEPGDHLAIFPANSDEDVKFVMDHMINKPAEDEEVQLYEYNVIDGNNCILCLSYYLTVEICIG